MVHSEFLKIGRTASNTKLTIGNYFYEACNPRLKCSFVQPPRTSTKHGTEEGTTVAFDYHDDQGPIKGKTEGHFLLFSVLRRLREVSAAGEMGKSW